MKVNRFFRLIFFQAICASTILAGPQFGLPTASFDFGYVPQKSQVAHLYYIKSVGDEALKIAKVIPGCGCTQSFLEKDVINPGDSAALEFIFDTRLYSGLVAKRPRIETNAMPPGGFLFFNAEVINPADTTLPVKIKPWQVNFSLKAGSDSTRSLALTNNTDRILKLVVVDMPLNLFEVQIPKELGPGQSADVVFTLPQEMNVSDFAKSITIQSNDSLNSRFSIPVFRKSKTNVEDDQKP